MRVTLSLRATSATGGTLKTQSSCQANHTLNDLILKEKFYHSVIIYLMPETQIRFQSSVHLGTNPKEWTRPQTPWFSSDISTWMMNPVTSIVSGRVEEKGVGKLDVFCLGLFASSCFLIFATIFRTCRRWKKKSAKSVRRRYRRPESLQSCRSAWMISRKKVWSEGFQTSRIVWHMWGLEEKIPEASCKGLKSLQGILLYRGSSEFGRKFVRAPCFANIEIRLRGGEDRAGQIGFDILILALSFLSTCTKRKHLSSWIFLIHLYKALSRGSCPQRSGTRCLMPKTAEKKLWDGTSFALQMNAWKSLGKFRKVIACMWMPWLQGQTHKLLYRFHLAGSSLTTHDSLKVLHTFYIIQSKNHPFEPQPRQTPQAVLLPLVQKSRRISSMPPIPESADQSRLIVHNAAIWYLIFDDGFSTYPQPHIQTWSIGISTHQGVWVVLAGISVANETPRQICVFCLFASFASCAFCGRFWQVLSVWNLLHFLILLDFVRVPPVFLLVLPVSPVLPILIILLALPLLPLLRVFFGARFASFASFSFFCGLFCRFCFFRSFCLFCLIGLLCVFCLFCCFAALASFVSFASFESFASFCLFCIFCLFYAICALIVTVLPVLHLLPVFWPCIWVSFAYFACFACTSLFAESFKCNMLRSDCLQWGLIVSLAAGVAVGSLLHINFLLFQGWSFHRFLVPEMLLTRAHDVSGLRAPELGQLKSSHVATMVPGCLKAVWFWPHFCMIHEKSF